MPASALGVKREQSGKESPAFLESILQVRTDKTGTGQFVQNSKAGTEMGCRKSWVVLQLQMPHLSSSKEGGQELGILDN